MRYIDDLIVAFDKQKALDSADKLFRMLQKAEVSIKRFSVTVHHSIETTRKFHEAMLTEGGER